MISPYLITDSWTFMKSASKDSLTIFIFAVFWLESNKFLAISTTWLWGAYFEWIILSKLTSFSSLRTLSLSFFFYFRAICFFNFLRYSSSFIFVSEYCRKPIYFESESWPSYQQAFLCARLFSPYWDHASSGYQQTFSFCNLPSSLYLCSQNLECNPWILRLSFCTYLYTRLSIAFYLEYPNDDELRKFYLRLLWAYS